MTKEIKNFNTYLIKNGFKESVNYKDGDTFTAITSELEIVTVKRIGNTGGYWAEVKKDKDGDKKTDPGKILNPVWFKQSD